MAPSRQKYAAVLEWLGDHGVGRKQASYFVLRTRCDSLHSLRVYLRFQLPPLHLARQECVDKELHVLLGVGPEQAHKIVEDLDLHSFETVMNLSSSTAATASTIVVELPMPPMLPDSACAPKGMKTSNHEAAGGLTSHLAVLKTPSTHDDDPHKNRAPAAARASLAHPRMPTHQEGVPHTASIEFDVIDGTDNRAGVVKAGNSDGGARQGQFAAAAASHRDATGNVPTFMPEGSGSRLSGASSVWAQSNALLSKQLPHYHATVTVTRTWVHTILFYVTAGTLATYIITRLHYLVWKKDPVLSPSVDIPYSWIILFAEVITSLLALYTRQYFKKQTVQFKELRESELKSLFKEVQKTGAKQTVHVLIATYTEPPETVNESVRRFLAAPTPMTMQVNIYVCDDGHAKSTGPGKRAFVQEMRSLGHKNLFYIGDRVKKPGQINGKSTNLNHVLLTHIYPHVLSPEDVPKKDLLLVMDCDHMIKPEMLLKTGAVMLDGQHGVCLVPQHFHNVIYPDALDHANYDMVNKLEFAFAGGILLLTGTNMLISARAAFDVGHYGEQAGLNTSTHRGRPTQIFSEEQTSEDVLLGSRLHAGGYKGVFLRENLATGEVPEGLAAMLKQRSRWAKGGHMFVLDPKSVFTQKQQHMTLLQKMSYCAYPIKHFANFFADPFIIFMPFMCLVLDRCVYGMDALLFWTSLGQVITSQAGTLYYDEWEHSKGAFMARVAGRVKWFISIKACMNTMMVSTGWKKKQKFKVTLKQGEKHADRTQGLTQALSNFKLHQIHDALSEVTDKRKAWLPFDGTLDVWVILLITVLTLVALVVGVARLPDPNPFADLTADTTQREKSLKWNAVVWGLLQAMEGLIIFGYIFTWEKFPVFLKYWVPLLVSVTWACIITIELRFAYSFATNP